MLIFIIMGSLALVSMTVTGVYCVCAWRREEAEHQARVDEEYEDLCQRGAWT